MCRPNKGPFAPVRISVSCPAFALISVFIKPIVPLFEEKRKGCTVAASGFTAEFQFLSANGRTDALNRPTSITNFPGCTRSRTRPAAVVWPSWTQVSMSSPKVRANSAAHRSRCLQFPRVFFSSSSSCFFGTTWALFFAFGARIP